MTIIYLSLVQNGWNRCSAELAPGMLHYLGQ